MVVVHIAGHNQYNLDSQVDGNRSQSYRTWRRTFGLNGTEHIVLFRAVATRRVQQDVVFQPLHRIVEPDATRYDERIAHVHLRVAVVDDREVVVGLVLAVGGVTGVD